MITTITSISFYCSTIWSVAIERRYVAPGSSRMGAFSRGVNVGWSDCGVVSVGLVALHIAFSSKIYACSRCHLHGGAEPHGDQFEDGHWMICFVDTARQMRSAERSAGQTCEVRWLVVWMEVRNAPYSVYSNPFRVSISARSQCKIS